MAFIIWVDRYNVGIDEIDIQHKKLVELINVLFDTISLKDRKEALNKAFTELVNYTIYHFKLEEELMKTHHFPEYDSHKKEHLAFVDKVNNYIRTLKIEDTKALLEIINFLKNWLLNHILINDKKYVKYVNK